jgi:hypothetical protein
LQLDTVHEKNRQRRLVFPDIVEKGVLKARYSFGGHVFSVFVEEQFGLPAYRIRLCPCSFSEQVVWSYHFFPRTVTSFGLQMTFKHQSPLQQTAES